MKTAIEKIRLANIVVSDGTQVRAGIDQPTVDEYAAAMLAGDTFPPVDVFQFGSVYMLADGFHRVWAAKQINQDEIPATILTGEPVDCLKHALGSNAKHGLPRSIADKTKAVKMAVKQFPGESDREIAKICKVSHPFVSSIRSSSGATVTTPENKVPAAAPETISENLAREDIANRNRETTDTKAAMPLDCLGFPVPPETLALWSRGGEIYDDVLRLSEVRNALTKSMDSSDPLYAGFALSGWLCDLNLLESKLRAQIPYAICPYCQGKLPARCENCKGRGFVGKFFWETAVPEELRNIRLKQIPTTRKA